MRNPPEENATFQEHIDWLCYAYWEKPIVLPIMNHLLALGEWLLYTAIPAIADLFEPKEVDRK